jgi:hypothetical protein
MRTQRSATPQPFGWGFSLTNILTRVILPHSTDTNKPQWFFKRKSCDE